MTLRTRTGRDKGKTIPVSRHGLNRRLYERFHFFYRFLGYRATRRFVRIFGTGEVLVCRASVFYTRARRFLRSTNHGPSVRSQLSKGVTIHCFDHHVGGQVGCVRLNALLLYFLRLLVRIRVNTHSVSTPSGGVFTIWGVFEPITVHVSRVPTLDLSTNSPTSKSHRLDRSTVTIGGTLARIHRRTSVNVVVTIRSQDNPDYFF